MEILILHVILQVWHFGVSERFVKFLQLGPLEVIAINLGQKRESNLKFTSRRLWKIRAALEKPRRKDFTSLQNPFKVLVFDRELGKIGEYFRISNRKHTNSSD